MRSLPSGFDDAGDQSRAYPSVLCIRRVDMGLFAFGGIDEPGDVRDVR